MECWRGSNAERGLLESASLGLDKASAGVTKCVLCCDGTIGCHIPSDGSSGSGQERRGSMTFRCDVHQAYSPEGGLRTTLIVGR